MGSEHRMATFPPAALVDALTFRYATKRFDAARRIDAETWNALEQSLVLTPSSFGLQPWRFLIITDPVVREELVAHTWKQRQVADCSHLVVMAVRKTVDEEYIDRFVARTAEVRGVAVESLAGYRRMLAGSTDAMTVEWAAKQAYIALGQFMLAAAMLGVDTCPMEGFLPNKYDEVLGLEREGLTTAVLCPAGYRAADDKYASIAKVRWAAEDVIDRRD
ncbi:MAG TPA: NAD(P)H-dependent oxidoreductase [Verrucomicrobiales bacterium]|nr:NAD(P)H-dependent oxidoreductase [Verrucomicrobiales bacterium]